MTTEPLEKQLLETTAEDEVQIFDTSEAVNKRDHISGRVDMGKSPMRMNCAFEQEADTIIAKTAREAGALVQNRQSFGDRL